MRKEQNMKNINIEQEFEDRETRKNNAYIASLQLKPCRLCGSPIHLSTDICYDCVLIQHQEGQVP